MYWNKKPTDELLGIIRYFVDNNDKELSEKLKVIYDKIDMIKDREIKNGLSYIIAKQEGTDIKDMFSSELDYVHFINDQITKFSEWEKVYHSLNTVAAKKEHLDIMVRQVKDRKYTAKASVLKFIHKEFGDDVFTNKKIKTISKWNLEKIFQVFFSNSSDLKRFKIKSELGFTTSQISVRTDMIKTHLNILEKYMEYNIPFHAIGNLDKTRFVELFELLKKHGLKDRERHKGKRSLLELLVKNIKNNDFYNFDEDEVDSIALDIYSWNRAIGTHLISRFKKDKTQHIYTMLKL